MILKRDYFTHSIFVFNNFFLTFHLVIFKLSDLTSNLLDISSIIFEISYSQIIYKLHKKGYKICYLKIKKTILQLDCKFAICFKLKVSKWDYTNIKLIKHKIFSY